VYHSDFIDVPKIQGDGVVIGKESNGVLYGHGMVRVR